MPRSQIETLTSAALLCVIAGILVAVLLPATSLGDEGSALRSLSQEESWVVHAMLFSALGLTVGLRLAAADPRRTTTNWVVASVVLIAAFATATEVAQLGAEGRTPSVGDWIADLIGMAIGLTIAARYGPPAIDRLVARTVR